MKKQRIFSVLATVVLTLSVAGSAFAAPYSSTYTGTIGTESSSIHFPEVNEGESYSVTLVFDNGGSTAANQTWNETHLTCIFFNVNDAGDVTYAQDLTVATIDQSSGLIVTDAGGVLTSMFDRVIDDTVAPGTYEASGIALQDSLAWYLNSSNDVFFSDVENTGYDLAFGDVTGGVQMGTS
jgi:hypothetical protein